MEKEELIAALSESRDNFLAAIEGLSDEEYELPILENRSIKDLLAHLTIWEAQLITLLFRMGSGQKPNTAHFKKETRPDINMQWFEQHRERPLEKVMEDFEGIRNQTIRRVEEISESDLANPNKFGWLKGKPLWRWILQDTIEHESTHLAHIISWRNKKH